MEKNFLIKIKIKACACVRVTEKESGFTEPGGEKKGSLRKKIETFNHAIKHHKLTNYRGILLSK